MPTMMQTTSPAIHQIGETAGAIWRLLQRNGPMSVIRLVRELDEPRDLVMQALGWLAREDKISITEHSRTRMVRLRVEE